MALTDGIKRINEHFFNVSRYFPSSLYFCIGRADPSIFSAIDNNPGYAGHYCRWLGTTGGRLTFSQISSAFSEPSSGGYARVALPVPSYYVNSNIGLAFDEFNIDFGTVSFPISTGSWGMDTNFYAITDSAMIGSGNVINWGFLDPDMPPINCTEAGRTISGIVRLRHILNSAGFYGYPPIPFATEEILKHAYGISEYPMSVVKFHIYDYVTGTILLSLDFNSTFEWVESNPYPDYYVYKSMINTSEIELTIDPIDILYSTRTRFAFGITGKAFGIYNTHSDYVNCPVISSYGNNKIQFFERTVSTKIF